MQTLSLKKRVISLVDTFQDGGGFEAAKKAAHFWITMQRYLLASANHRLSCDKNIRMPEKQLWRVYM